jgi:short-subunit dehydrogenase
MQSVVITGGSAGAGCAVAEAYAHRGCRIGLIARGRARLEDAASRLQELGAPAVEVASADVAEAAEVEAAADRFEQALGAIDVWVNAVMSTVYAPFVEMSANEYVRVTRVVTWARSTVHVRRCSTCARGAAVRS